MESRDRLDRVLDELRSSPSVGPEFTSRVLRRIDEEPAARRHSAGWSIAAALVLSAGLASWWGVRVSTDRERTRQRTEVTEVRLEMQRLESELAALEDDSSKTRPSAAVWVASTEHVDVFFDPRRASGPAEASQMFLSAWNLDPRED